MRGDALRDEPLAFGSAPGDDRFDSAGSVRDYLRRASDAVVIGAFRDGLLIGAAGAMRENRIKTGHKAYVWGMYVRPEERQRGVASQILAALKTHAATLPGVTHLHLSVSSAAPAALRLDTSAGFVAWGTEPQAIRCAAGAADEHHMVYQLP